MGEGEITARVSRLLEPPPPLPRAAQAGIILASALLIASVVLLVGYPLRRIPQRGCYHGPYGPLLLPPLWYSLTFGRTSTW